MCIYTLSDLVLIWIDDLFDDELLLCAGQTSILFSIRLSFIVFE